MLKKSIIAIFSLMILASLTACNTTRGVGEDIQAGGKAIQRSAE
ncbi:MULTISPECIES: entericidin A/B family lipoprotein [Serratia]|jgi:entericidin B|uniref:ECN family pore-forming entericidin n=2 Tax=Serratia TaxID=613 RepID=A0A1Q4P297_SERMA|nr:MULTISPECIES: entericidin A/B family lipoprotein [Serratia]AOF01866.1 ECN family pore-forming entericidin [Serratia surfactantfaciens]MBH1920130.1 entericidin A/B family lipoprotein [Serratia surfactantfaciens]MBI6151111.1 entericidin A/B family lipoprotein [Serratia surfactantfaciens]MTD07894.1 entericidin A/B family lipoprotein [Serratia sp. YC16]OKB67260.1 ECN family pore-forming entericidin [Serratia marcescens]